MIQRKLFKSLVMAASIVGLLSCSFQDDSFSKKISIRNISEDTTYRDILRQGFMGGSLIYNEKDNSLGHLSEGVTVAVRLSRAERKDLSSSEAVFKEKDGSAVYGLLVCEKVDSDSISFLSKLYDVQGNVYSEKFISLNKGEKADINNDGIADIQYVSPSEKRSGYEKAVYLKFLSSQEDLNVSMYAVFKEQYPGKAYPNGIIGVNSDEKFIIQKYSDEKTSKRSVVTGVYKGDYVVDSLNGSYQKVSNNQYSRSARSVNDIDLVNLEDSISGKELFYFTEDDFAFSDAEDFLAVLPSEITEKYAGLNGIEKLNKILEDKELLVTVDGKQGSILPADEKNMIFSQFNELSLSETVQLNRVFLEKNYPVSCPQRVTVSSVITEVLPLASVVFTGENLVEDADFENEYSRAASFKGFKTKDEYLKQLSVFEKDFAGYSKVYSYDFKAPLAKQSDENGAKVTANLKLNNSLIAVGVKGTFTSTWGSVKSSLGAAAFFKAAADVGIDISRSDDYKKLSVSYKGEENPSVKKESDKSVKIPVVNKTVKLYEFELCSSTNVATFAVGPVILGVNLDLSVGLPVNMKFEMDCSLTYDAFIAGLAKANVSVGVDYGIDWKKKWLMKVPEPYVNWNGNGSASADAIFFFDQNFKSLKANFNKLSAEVTVSPYVKQGLSLSAAAVVHAGFNEKFGVTGACKFGYSNPYLKGTYRLDNNSSINASVTLGLKGVKVLGVNIGNLSKTWEWELLKMNKNVVPETDLFSYKL